MWRVLPALISSIFEGGYFGIRPEGGGCKDSNIRGLKDIDRRDLKFGVLTQLQFMDRTLRKINFF